MTPEDSPADAPSRTMRVSIGEFQVAIAGERLVIYGLGSCVALLLHDPSAQISALGHVLLPEPPPDRPAMSPGRFATTAVPAMVAALRKEGASRSRLVAKVAGAAEMFQYERRTEGEGIGARNLRATLETLERLGIQVAGRDTGGSYGRTVFVDGATGRMAIRAVRIDEHVL